MTYKLPMKADGSVDLDELGTDFIYMSFDAGFVEVLKILIDNAKAEEREACAKVVDRYDATLNSKATYPFTHSFRLADAVIERDTKIVEAIRNRGQQDD